jgi:Pvc16 N-terminal domain
MGGALALGAVTALLKRLLENGLASAGISSLVGADAIVSALAPDRIASGEEERPQLNLFLYLVTPRTGLSGNGRDRSPGRPGLALDLHYLVTAYGAQDLQAEILLGHAIATLHATPVLEQERIRSALAPLGHGKDRRVVAAPLVAVSEPDVASGFERLTIEPEFMNAEAVSKIWSALQAKYRPSAAYKVSAVMIAATEAAVPPPAPARRQAALR